MSVATIEVTELEGIDLEGAPPCEIILNPYPAQGPQCGRPSDVRLWIYCACARLGAGFRFYCRQHYETEILPGLAHCVGCGSTMELTWRET